MKNSNKNLLNLLAFVALVIIATLLFVQHLLPIIGVTIGGPLFGVLSTIQNILILIVVGVSAYNFAANNRPWIRILFWISVIIYIVGTVLIWL